MVVINGGPDQSSIDELNTYGILFSHSIGNAHTDLDVFTSITGLADRVSTAAAAPGQIDNALSVAIMRKRPVYLEVPKGMWTAQCMDPAQPLPSGPRHRATKAPSPRTFSRGCERPLHRCLSSASSFRDMDWRLLLRSWSVH